MSTNDQDKWKENTANIAIYPRMSNTLCIHTGVNFYFSLNYKIIIDNHFDQYCAFELI